MISRVLSGKCNDDLRDNLETITKELMTELDKKSTLWGVELLDFSLATWEPIPTSALVSLLNNKFSWLNAQDGA